MDVRVFGPNLRDQRKGTFHVHEASCDHLDFYGPGRINGGNCFGYEEGIIKDATVAKIVEEVYADQLDEGGTIEDLTSDFWFAPCCKKYIPHDDNEIQVQVYECWVAQNQDSFIKYTDLNDVVEWTKRILLETGVGQHIHIAVHSTSEYTTG